MVNTVGENTASKCPMSQIRKDAENIRQRCYEIFGNPNIKNSNTLGGFNGAVFVDFLEEFHKNIHNIDIISPDEMVDVEAYGTGLSAQLAIAAFEVQGKKKVTRLAYIMYKKFLKSHISGIEAANEQDRIMKEFHMIGFTITFIQAFDAIFMTGVREIDSQGQWNEIKNDMRGVAHNLSRIPSDIQEGLTSSHDKISYSFGKEKPYMLEHIGEIFSVQALVPEISFAGVYDSMEAKGGYGLCPAMMDGSLNRAFDILFDIYGKVFVESKS